MNDFPTNHGNNVKSEMIRANKGIKMWVNGNDIKLNSLIKEMNKGFKRAIETDELDIDGFMVSTLHAKIGNKLYSFDLDE